MTTKWSEITENGCANDFDEKWCFAASQTNTSNEAHFSHRWSTLLQQIDGRALDSNTHVSSSNSKLFTNYTLTMCLWTVCIRKLCMVWFYGKNDRAIKRKVSCHKKKMEFMHVCVYAVTKTSNARHNNGVATLFAFQPFLRSSEHTHAHMQEALKLKQHNMIMSSNVFH